MEGKASTCTNSFFTYEILFNLSGDEKWKIYCLQHILTRFYEDQEKKCGWRCLIDSEVNHVNEKKSNLETNILSLQTLIGLSKDDILFDSQEY